jgi:hypothetical protein
MLSRAQVVIASQLYISYQLELMLVIPKKKNEIVS